MISFLLLLTVLLLTLLTCKGLDRDGVFLVRHFVKEWKGYDSVNIFSCRESLVISDLSILNDDLIMFRYIDLRRPIDTGQLDRDNNCRQVFVVDLNCNEAVPLMRTLSNENVFTTFCRSFLLVDSNEDGTWFEEYFQAVLMDIELTVTSDVVYATKWIINGTFPTEEGNIGNRFYFYDVWYVRSLKQNCSSYLHISYNSGIQEGSREVH